MTDEPLLTVAIPTYQGARHLAEALRSILAQADVPFHLLVCDDRSNDDTIGIARAEAGGQAQVVVNSERLGLAGNWNQCVALSRTPFVAVFHQDDVMRAGHLSLHLAAFRKDDRVGLVASAADVIDADGRTVPESVVGRGGLGPVDRVFAPGEALRLIATGNPLRCSAITLRKDAHRDAGGFDPSYRYVVDWALWLEVARKWAVAWLATPTVGIRWHAASETHRFKTGTADLDETGRLLNDFFTRDGAAWPDAKRLRRGADRLLARAFLARAHESLRGGNADLAQKSLTRAYRLWPGLVARIAADPRLAAQMASLAIAPGAAGRFWAKGSRPGDETR